MSFNLLSVSLPACLGTAAWIDSRKLVTADLLILPLIPAGLVLCLVSAPTLADRLIGVVAGFLAVTLIARLYKHLRHQDAVEMVDAKLVAAAGAWVGWQALPFLVLVAAVAALLWTYLWQPDPDRPISLAPFLALGFWLVWQFGPLAFG